MQEDIKIKIQADTSEAKSDINKLGAKGVKVKTKFEKPEKNLFKEVEQEIETLEKKIKNIKLKKGNFSTTELLQLRKEIESTALKAKTINFDKAGKSADKLINKLKNMHKEISKNKSGLESTDKIFTKLDLLIVQITSYIATKGVEAVKQLVSEGIKFNKELEYADKKIQSISGKNSFEIQTNISDIALGTGTDAIELRNGLYEIISAVGDVEEAYDILETANKLAITGFTDITNAVDGLTTVLNAYKMQLSEADRIANIFVKTQQYGKITVDQFARDLAQSVPYATQLGIKIEEIGTAIALLTSRGVKPAQAETQLASFLRNILDDNTEITKELNKQLGKNVKQYIENGGSLIKLIEEISNIEKKLGKAVTSFSMDSEAKTFILTMKDSVEDYKRFYKEISNTENTIDANIANMMNSQKAFIDRAKEYWKELSRIAGKSAGEIIAFLGDIVTGYDRQANTTTILNSKLKENLDVVESLGNKNNKTKKEQDSLNNSLEYLKIMAPDIVSAYNEFAKTGKNYADVLELIKKKQDEVNESNKYTIYSQNKEEIEKREKNNQKLKKRLDRYFNGHYGSGAFRNIPIEEAMFSGLVSELNNPKSKKYNPEKFLKIQSEFEAYLRENKKINELRKINEDILRPKKKSIENNIPEISENKIGESYKTEINIVDSKKNDDEKLVLEKEYKRKQLEIETAYNNAMLKATQTYNTQMAELKGQGTEQEIQSIKEAYQKALTEAEFTKQKDTITNKMENTFYDNDTDRALNNKYLQSEKDFMIANNQMEISEQQRIKAEEERKKAEEELKKSLDNVSSNLKNLSSLFQTIGDNTESIAIKNLANIGSIGSTIFDTLKNSEQGKKFLSSIFGKNYSNIFDNISVGAGIGSAISGALGGGAEGNIGSTIGSGIGTAVGGSVGGIIGGALGGAVGSVFGSKSKKRKKREAEKRKKAQERLKKGMISGQFKWEDVLEEYNEDLQRAGMGEYIGLFDKVSVNTDYDKNLSMLENAKRGKDGVSMSVLRSLMPQYNDQQIMDWFKSIAGGAVLDGDTLKTGEGKYGPIDISALAQEVTSVNRELEDSLKDTIKNIIDFSADSLAQVVKEGFFNGTDELGNNIERMIANSLKNAFLNTELSKNLFNGLSDKVENYVKDLFKNDKNLGINLEIGNLENLSFTQYIDLIKKYMEISNDKLEDLFKELGLNIDNLTQSMDTLNQNMSKNLVSGIATNLWKQNLGIKEPYKINQNINLEIPVMLNGKEMDRYIIKTVNGSLKRSRRSGNGIKR